MSNFHGQLILSYPYWFIGLCLLLGLALAGILYVKDQLLNDHRFLKWFLFVFRTLTISTIAFLLLGPIWKGFITKTEKPIVIYMEDVSSSIKSFTPISEYQKFETGRIELLNALSEKYEVRSYLFGSDLIPKEDTSTIIDKATNISESIEKMFEIHSYQNVGAVILATDGIYNQGYSPAYSKIGNNTSIYTIALGDTSSSRDIFVQQLKYPKVVYLGDQFQLDIDWGAYNLKGKSTKLRVIDERNNVLLDKSIAINDEEVFELESLIIDAKYSGVQKLRVELIGAVEEEITANNYQYAYVEVLDGRKRVLILYNGPHPDIKALKSVIDNNKNFEVNVSSIAKFDLSIDPFDLIIFHGIPAIKEGTKGRNLFSEVKKKGKSIGIIITENTDINFLNSNQNILKIKSTGQEPNQVQGLFNNNFNDFQLPDGLSETFRANPPLLCPYGDYEEGPNTKTLIYQRIEDINTGFPMVITGQEGESKMMIITGEGIWRWRMSEYARNENTTVFDKLFNQLIQYVAIKEDKRKFRLIASDHLIWENDPVFFNAELYNANYELINTPDVTLKVKDDNEKEYTYVFDKTLNAYSLDAGLLPIGNYTASAQTKWANENYSTSLKFVVREVQLESLNKQANHKMLYNLSDASGGKMFEISEMGNIADSINQNVNLKPILYDTVKNNSLLQFKWIFFILLGLLTVEWVVRKWIGGV